MPSLGRVDDGAYQSASSLDSVKHVCRSANFRRLSQLPRWSNIFRLWVFIQLFGTARDKVPRSEGTATNTVWKVKESFQRFRDEGEPLEVVKSHGKWDIQ